MATAFPYYLFYCKGVLVLKKNKVGPSLNRASIYSLHCVSLEKFGSYLPGPLLFFFLPSKYSSKINNMKKLILSIPVHRSAAVFFALSSLGSSVQFLSVSGASPHTNFCYWSIRVPSSWVFRVGVAVGSVC